MPRRSLVLTPEQFAAHQAKLKGNHGAALLTAPPPQVSPTPNKHGAITDFRGALRFDSKKQARCWDELLLRKLAGELTHVQREVTFRFTLEGVDVGRYRADFYYRDSQGQWHVADCKSRHTAKLPGWWRTKQLLLACYGYEVIEL